MVPRAWLAVIRFGFWLSLLICMIGLPLSVQADPGTICEQAYGEAPTIIPNWLMPAQPEINLTTANRYDLLAAKLLSSGLVDGSSCPGWGLNPDGSANGCGVEISSPLVSEWQNQFDQGILKAARTSSVPPKVIKALIAVESQFWPGADWQTGEFGLGQMTVYGADLLLKWHPKTYLEVCVQVLDEASCQKPYHSLEETYQRMLQGWVLRNLDASCSACPGGVDREKGEQAVQVLADTLNASCRQTARMIRSATGKAPAAVMNYEDFWRVSLANYHVGSGCLYQAVQRSGNPHTWNGIAASFSASCASGAEYIRRIEEQIKP